MSDWSGRYFSLHELTGHREVPPDVRDSLAHLVETVLDPWRERIGGPLRVTSGYRTREENTRIPTAAPDSWHVRGQAVDVAPTSVGVDFAFACLGGLPFDKAILYARHIHVQARQESNISVNRRWRYRATYQANGSVRYDRL